MSSCSSRGGGSILFSLWSACMEAELSRGLFKMLRACTLPSKKPWLWKLVTEPFRAPVQVKKGAGLWKEEETRESCTQCFGFFPSGLCAPLIFSALLAHVCSVESSPLPLGLLGNCFLSLLSPCSLFLKTTFCEIVKTCTSGEIPVR